MRVKLVCVVALLATSVAACGPTLTPEQQAALDRNIERNATLKAGDLTMIGQVPFDVRVTQSREVALVRPVAGKANINMIEAAARQKTGCAAKALPVVYEAADNKPTQLLARSVTRKFGGQLPVRLSC